MSDVLRDQQGNALKVGLAYKMVIGRPGPDTSTVILKKINDDQTLSVYDVYFEMENECKPDDLWKPIKHGWKTEELELICKFGGQP